MYHGSKLVVGKMKLNCVSSTLLYINCWYPVLGTFKAATEFLEKKGGIYSSRPRNILV